MKAIVYHKYGTADVLQFTDVNPPQPTASQVRIQVAACSVNPIDWRLRQGEARWLLPFGFPRIPGYDLAGTIETAPVGSGFQPGDRVAAFLDHVTGGAYAQLAVCSPGVVARLPERMSMEDGAAIGLAGTTALQCLRDHGRLGIGQHVVITGASGGVGSLAVQIAVARGARVTAVASSQNQELVMELGASQFVDYHDSGWLRRVEDCDLFFDAAGKCNYAELRWLLKADGRFVTTEPNLKYAALSLWTALKPGQRVRTMLAMPNSRDLRELLHLWEQNQLRIIRNDTFPLADAAAAHRHGEQGLGTGKIVLTVPGSM